MCCNRASAAVFPPPAATPYFICSNVFAFCLCVCVPSLCLPSLCRLLLSEETGNECFACIIYWRSNALPTRTSCRTQRPPLPDLKNQHTPLLYASSFIIVVYTPFGMAGSSRLSIPLNTCVLLSFLLSRKSSKMISRYYAQHISRPQRHTPRGWVVASSRWWHQGKAAG